MLIILTNYNKLKIWFINYKPFKVLLGLTECEIEKELGMDKQLHKRKLIMALNEFRNSNATLALDLFFD